MPLVTAGRALMMSYQRLTLGKSARLTVCHSCRAVQGKIGEVVEVTGTSFQVTAQGGRIEVLRAKLGDGKKSDATDLIASGAIRSGQILGT